VREPSAVGAHMAHDLGAEFELYHEENPHIFEELKERALVLKNAGRKRGSIAQLFEVLRYDHAVRTTGEEFKLGNNHRAFYARVLMAACPELRGFFIIHSQEHEYEPDLVALGIREVPRWPKRREQWDW